MTMTVDSPPRIDHICGAACPLPGLVKADGGRSTGVLDVHWLQKSMKNRVNARKETPFPSVWPAFGAKAMVAACLTFIGVSTGTEPHTRLARKTDLSPPSLQAHFGRKPTRQLCALSTSVVAERERSKGTNRGSSGVDRGSSARESTVTAAPRGVGPKVIRPGSNAVVQNNAIRVMAVSHNNEAPLLLVGKYVDSNRRTVFDTIGLDSVPPYEFLWDCRHVPDQSWLDCYLRCIQVSVDGDTLVSPRQYVVIDRNLAKSTATFLSWYSAKPVRIDGANDTLACLHDSGFIDIVNDDNRFRVYSCWDETCLYLFAHVKDSIVYSRFAVHDSSDKAWDDFSLSDVPPVPQIWLDDCVSFFFDVNNSKSHLPQPDDRRLFVSPTGRYITTSRNRSLDSVVNWNDEGLRIVARTAQDSVGGYRIGAAVPWKSLGVRPKAGLRIGFELYLVDRDRPLSDRVIIGWSAQPHAHTNPSEWGTLVLRARDTAPITLVQAAMLILAALVLGSLVWIWSKVTSSAGPRDGAQGEQSSFDEAEQSPQRRYFHEVKQYVDEHWHSPELSRDTAAKAIHISSSYLGKFFRKESGMSFSEYVNSVRISHAKELLLSSNMSITRIALSCGYGTLEHFTRTFKKMTGSTPREFRHKG
ncbi:MAG: helix-turn-helix domain-containing protein [Chitinivibrionales bacterium]|nr:helix-turn-helix domain-containing protein [Chitinivibrionales bacterium]